jgi:hypothetical protein
LFTVNWLTIVPSDNCVHEGWPVQRVALMEQAPILPLKPEPTTFTRVPMDPEVGDRTIVGVTWKTA